MVETVDLCIMEAVQAATRVNFETEKMAKERLRLPARMKGGGIKRATDKRYPAFLGEILDVLPRVIDRKDEDGEVTVGVYSNQMNHIIGEGAYDTEGHRNTMFLEATGVGPFPREMQQAWTKMRQEAIENYGLVEEEDRDEWGRLGPVMEPTPATIRNRGAAERKARGRVEAYMTTPENRSQTDPATQLQRAGQREEKQREDDQDELREAVAGSLSQAERDEQAS
jgi:hypothetical protein